MTTLKIVKLDNLHETIFNYISDNNIPIVEYDNMKECILQMIRGKYIFNMNRDRLRDAMEDITYIMSPEDEVNKDRVEKGLEYEYSDEEMFSDDDDDDCLTPRAPTEADIMEAIKVAVGEAKAEVKEEPVEEEPVEEVKEEPVEEVKEEPVEEVKEEPVEEVKEEPVEG